MRSVVVLPAPFGPKQAKTSPRSTVKETSRHPGGRRTFRQSVSFDGRQAAAILPQPSALPGVFSRVGPLRLVGVLRTPRTRRLGPPVLHESPD